MEESLLKYFDSTYVPVLYKYRSLEKENDLKHFYDLLKFGEVYFSEPEKLNDPFDGKIEYAHKEYKDEEILEYSRRHGFTNQQMINLEYSLKNNLIDKKTILGKDTYQPKETKILCLSQDETNLLMWTHYANNHKGVCIGFNTVNKNNFCCIKIKEGLKPNDDDLLKFFNVKYDENMPPLINKINRDTNRTIDRLKFYFTKSELWNYEKEMRTYIHTDLIEKEPLKIDVTNIQEVIFGLRTPDCLKKDIQNIVIENNKNGCHIKLYECHEVHGMYKIEKKEYK
jgi:hypothetical protein